MILLMDGEVLQPDRLSGSHCGTRLAQLDLDSGGQLIRMKRFGHVVVREFKPVQLVVNRRPGRKHDDRDRGMFLFESLPYRESVQSGQHHVENNQGASICRLRGSFAACEPNDVISSFFKVIPDPCGNFDVVLNV
ncbi:hypothetical protein D1872_252810 [compost metagenome]